MFGIDQVGCAHLLCQFQFVGNSIHRNNFARRRQHTPLNHIQPNAAAAKDRHGRACFHARPPNDRTNSRNHRTANQTCLFQRSIIRHADTSICQSDGLLNKGGSHMKDRFAVTRHSADRLVWIGFTQCGMPTRAISAMTTHRINGKNHFIARRRLTLVRPLAPRPPLHAPSPTECAWSAMPCHEMVITVTYTCGNNIEQTSLPARIPIPRSRRNSGLRNTAASSLTFWRNVVSGIYSQKIAPPAKPGDHAQANRR